MARNPHSIEIDLNDSSLADGGDDIDAALTDLEKSLDTTAVSSPSDLTQTPQLANELSLTIRWVTETILTNSIKIKLTVSYKSIFYLRPQNFAIENSLLQLYLTKCNKGLLQLLENYLRYLFVWRCPSFSGQALR